MVLTAAVTQTSLTFVAGWSTTTHLHDVFSLKLIKAALLCVSRESFQRFLCAVCSVWPFQILELRNSKLVLFLNTSWQSKKLTSKENLIVSESGRTHSEINILTVWLT